MSSPSPSIIPAGWKKIWEMKTGPRMRLFMWRACSNALPTRANLYHRGGIEDPICGLCGEESETVDHILLKCPMVRPVWYGGMTRLSTEQLGEVTFKEFLWNNIETLQPEQISLIAYTAGEIWQHRNAKIFEKKPFDFFDVIIKAERKWTEFQSAWDRAPSPDKKKEPIKKWSRPGRGQCKLNCDAAVGMQGRIGMGFVIRDEKGVVQLAGKKEIRAEGGTMLLEGMAVRYGLQMSKQYHMKVDQVESDNKNLIDCLNGHTIAEIYCDVIVRDIQELMAEVGCTTTRFIPRQANSVVHHLARGPACISIRHTPEHVALLLKKDVID